jgi:branched-chain amino acid transport system substrate-binding protein
MPAQSQYAGAQCNPYFFSVSYQNDNMHEAVGKVVTDKGFKKVAILAPNYPAGKDALAGFKRYFKGEVVQETYTALNQLDYGAELSKIRASGADACTSSCPAAWASTSSSSLWGGPVQGHDAVWPRLLGRRGRDPAVGEPMLGMFNSSQWAHDMDNAANKQVCGRLPEGIRPPAHAVRRQGYDAAMLMDAAVRDTKGNLDDKDAVRKAWKPPSSTRCAVPSSSTPTTTPFRTTTCVSSPRTARAGSPTAR